MKKHWWHLNGLTVLFVIGLQVTAVSQDNYLTNIEQQQTALVDFKENKGSFFLTGTRVNTLRPNVLEANLFKPGWLIGVVQFKNGKQFETKLKFDVVSNQLYFDNDGKINRFAELVAGFTLLDTIKNALEVVRFNNGYPRFGKQSSETFYQVMTYGKRVQLLKYIRSYVVQQQDYNMMTRFTTKLISEYYLYNIRDNTLKLFKGSMKSFEKILPELTTRRSLFADPKHLTEKEMIQVVNEVNNS